MTKLHSLPHARSRAVALGVSRNRIKQRLVTLYGEEVAEQTLPRIMQIVTDNRRPPRCAPLSQEDVILIAYPDHVQAPGRPPLEMLDRFITRELDGLVSGVHVLPFYPSSGDKGFAVSTTVRLIRIWAPGEIWTG